MRDYCYDIESFPNIFTCAAKHHVTGTRYRYEISHRRNDRAQLIAWLHWLHDNKCRMVGYNNEGFDYPVLHFILCYPDMTAAEIYRYVQTLIDSDNRYGNAVRDPYVEQLDLYKLHDFDRPTKATSLKALEFNMKKENIVDLPFPPGTWLTELQMDVLVSYNDDDVDATDDFLGYSQEQVHFREKLSERFGKNMLNYNDPKIGKEYFIQELERRAPGTCFQPGTRKPRQTLRPLIDFKDVVFPWIEFKRPEFQAVCDWFKRQVITKTKGVFSNISEENLAGGLEVLYTSDLSYADSTDQKPIAPDVTEDSLGNLAQYCELRRRKVLLKPDTVVPEGAKLEVGKNKKIYAVWNDVKNLHVIVNGFRYDFGTGGIHGSVSSRSVYSDDEYVIEDLDVASYYPNLGMKNRIYPQHLGEQFCDAYEGLYHERKQYPKGSSENAGIKLGLNSVYGQSNNAYSCFYDPLYTMSITVNGQLLLCLAAERLIEIPGLEIIQVNTDGITIRYPRAMKPYVDAIARWWQDHTKLELESVEYKSMHIRDVNNYIAVSADGKKVKRKGAYAHKFEPPNLNKGNGDLEWHQNHSALVVPKAAEAVLVRGEDLVQFITNHADPFDFMLRAKVPRNCRLYIGDTQVQNITRYYVVHTGGGSMVKVMPPLAKAPDKERYIGICTGRKVRDCNNMVTFDRSLIDYGFYIEEAEKLIKPLIGGN